MLDAEPKTARSQKLFEELAARRPGLRSVDHEHGEQSLLHFSRRHLQPAPRELSPILLEVYHERISQLHGPAIATGVTDQLRRVPVVVTSDHVGLDTTSLLVGGKLALLEAARSLDLRYLVVSAAGGVNLGNPLSGYVEWEGNHTALYPGKVQGRKTRELLVYGAPPFTRQYVEALPARIREGYVVAALEPLSRMLPEAGRSRLRETLQSCADPGKPRREEMLRRVLGKEGYPAEGQEAFLKAFTRAADEAVPPAERLLRLLVDAISEKVYEGECFADQCCHLNFELWKRVYPDVSVIYLQGEDLSREILSRHLRELPQSLLSRLLIDPSLRNAVLTTFAGVEGCWDYGRGSGTQLFWGRGADGRSFPMRAEEIPTEAESLVRALQTRELVPGLFLTFCVELLCGLESIGGFNQALNYLPTMHSRLIALAAEQGLEGHGLEMLRPNLYSCGPLCLFDGIKEQPRPAGMAALLRDPESARTALERGARELTLGEAIRLSLPGQLDIVMTHEERASDEELYHTPVEALALEMGLDLSRYTVS